MFKYKNIIIFLSIMNSICLRADYTTNCKSQIAKGVIDYLQLQGNIDWATISAIYSDSCGMGSSDKQCPNNNCIPVILKTSSLEQLSKDSKGKNPNLKIIFSFFPDIFYRDANKLDNLYKQLSFQDKAMLDAYAKLPKDQTDPTSVNYQAYSDWYANQLINSSTPVTIKDQDTAKEKYLKRQVLLSLCYSTQTDCKQSALDYFKAQNDIQDIQAKIMNLLNSYNLSPLPKISQIPATNLDVTPFLLNNKPFYLNNVSNWYEFNHNDAQAKFLNMLQDEINKVKK